MDAYLKKMLWSLLMAAMGASLALRHGDAFGRETFDLIVDVVIVASIVGLAIIIFRERPPKQSA